MSDADRPGHPDRQDVTVDGLSSRAEGVGRLPDGRAVFVPFALPSERVRVDVVEHRSRWARGRLVEVLEASPDRVEAPCPYYGPGRCGGCQLQHLRPEQHGDAKHGVLTQQVRRIGGLADAPVDPVRPLAPWRYRSSARLAVAADGRLGFRRSGSSDVEPVDECLLLDEATQSLRDALGSGLPGVDEVTIRTGGAPGDAAVVLHTARRDPAPPGTLPDEVAVAAQHPRGAVRALRGDPGVSFNVAGRDFRVSAGAFFQPSSDAAAALTGLVDELSGAGPGALAFDLYAGVGVLSAPLARAGARVVAVESSRAAAGDARRNLRDLPVDVRSETVEAFLRRERRRPDVVVLDPPRAGAGPQVCARIAALCPARMLYVSCHPAAMARDLRALRGHGYAVHSLVPLDQFAQTAHLEVVATLVPA